MPGSSNKYQLHGDGIYRRVDVPQASHRDDEYPESGYENLSKMQDGHFWYSGRSKWIFYGFTKQLQDFGKNSTIDIIDLGCGAGGWLKYISQNIDYKNLHLNAADSSLIALSYTKRILDGLADHYLVDLLNLGWADRWDIIFMLDVIEHIPDQDMAIQEVCTSLKAGGKVVITAPALDFFWSANDVIAHHQRRYNRKAIINLANRHGLIVRECRYFMFLLSPLYFLARLRYKLFNKKSTLEDLVKEDQKIPRKSINSILEKIFRLETPLGFVFPFPWGTSIFAVLEKPKT
jgi:SAM-dependent methyltransferase